MNSPLTRPEPRRVVPRAVVDALIADADREISSLEHRVDRAVAAAAVAEARLAELGMDEQTSAWATIQLERFVTELRADADAESLALVEEAKVRARLLIEEAEYEARHRGLFAAVPAAIAAPEPEVAVDEPAAPIEAQVEPEPTPVVDLAIVEPVASAAVPDVEPGGEALFREITPEALAADESGPLEAEFWPAEAPRKRRFPRVRTVAAPTLAGLLVVAAVVLRVA